MGSLRITSFLDWSSNIVLSLKTNPKYLNLLLADLCLFPRHSVSHLCQQLEEHLGPFPAFFPGLSGQQQVVHILQEPTSIPFRLERFWGRGQGFSKDGWCVFESLREAGPGELLLIASNGVLPFKGKDGL